MIDLQGGNPDPELLPSLVAAIRAIPPEPVLYDAPADVRALIGFAKADFTADGIAVPEVIVTGGGLDAIDRILRDHVRPGDRVAVEDPVFPALLDLLAASGVLAEPIGIDECGPTPSAMEAVLRRRPVAAIITTRGQNPTGARLTPGRAADLRAVLKRHPEPLLIEGDPLGPVAGVPAITVTEGRARWTIVRSSAKLLGTDMRLALVAGDALTLARLRGRQAVGPRRVSHILQHLALALWSDPSSGRHLARVADTYAHRRETLVAALAAHHIEAPSPSGFNVWIPVSDETHVVEQLAERGWAVAAGERFRLQSGPGIRVTTSALAPDAARRFAADLASVMADGVLALA
jgi:DNA-binding transcriptional MocR family regulator